MLRRRDVLLAGASGVAILAALRYGLTASTPPALADETFEVTHSDAEWRKLLTPEQYKVLRQSATEAPFSSPLDFERHAGTYDCAGCALPLYSSETKYDSHTGWPSFWKPLDNAVGTTSDRSYLMTRTAVHCRRCGGHLGHVFDDGPDPTGLRYCMNGVAMTFVPKAASS
ncbi:MAG TPA: peptide-methionine (R)-S-oxide reductase MsrB [Stellaceae bacterium]